MITVSISDLQQLTVFWLVFTRCLATLFQFPIFDTFSIPSIIKILFSFVVAYCFYPKVSGIVLTDMELLGEHAFWFLTIFYTLVGIFIGFMLKVIMDIFLIGGTIVTQSIGFSAVRYFDPSFLQRIGPFEIYINWIILLLILISGALTPMFKGLYLSFWGMSFQNFSEWKFNYSIIFEFFKMIFNSGILISIPIMVINILITIVMGLSTRMIPQFNVLVLGFILNIGIGLIVFIIISNEFFTICFSMYKEFLEKWFQMIV